MKKGILLAILFISKMAIAQFSNVTSGEFVGGKAKFDSIKVDNLKNNVALDSILITDVNGKIKLIHKSAIGANGGIATGEGIAIANGQASFGGNPFTTSKTINTGNNGLTFQNNKRLTTISGGTLVFDDTIGTTNGNLDTRLVWQVKPLKKGNTYPFNFGHTSNAANGTTSLFNEVYNFGVNMAGNGRADQSLPFAMGESWESQYDVDGDGINGWLEKHEVVTWPNKNKTADEQIRLSSYTINPAHRIIDYYHTTTNFYLKPTNRTELSPFSIGFNGDSAARISLSDGLDDSYLIAADANALIIGNKNGSRTNTLVMSQFQNLRLNNSPILDINNTNFPQSWINGNFRINMQRRSYGNNKDSVLYDNGILRGSQIFDYSSGQYRIGTESGYYTTLRGGGVDNLRLTNIGVGVGNALVPTAKLDVQGTTGHNQFRLRTQYTPKNSADPNGAPGAIAVDDNFFYYKTSTGWKRAALQSF